MRIQRVVARAFGPFQGASLGFGPGMTVVAGPNEAGKSSWHAATRLALTGLRRGRGRATAADAALADRHRPWDNPDEWSVEALVSLDDGRTVEIRQDLAGKVACAAIDVGIGRDVSDEILDGTPDASRWLGLDRDAFATTVSVSQAQVLAVADAAEQLQEQMQRAAATRGTDATAAQAIERLTDFRKEAVGADTVAARGPLRAAKTRLAQARQALDQARERHEDYLERGARAELAERRVVAARLELDVARWAQARADAEGSAARARRATELAARHPEPPAPLVERDERADRVAAALDAWEHRPPAPTLNGPSSVELEAELRNLPKAPVGDRIPHPTVTAAARELDLAEEALRSQGPEPTPGELPPLPADRIRSLARRLRAPALPAGADRRRGPRESQAGTAAARAAVAIGLLLFASAIAMAVAGVPLAAAVAAGMGAILVAIGVVRARTIGRWEAGRAAPGDSSAIDDRTTALQEAIAAGLPPDADLLDELADRAVVAQRDHEDHARWLARRGELVDRCGEASVQLRRALEGRSVAVDGDARAAWAAYAADCERRGRLAEAAVRREGLESALAARRQSEAAAAAAVSATELALDALRSAGREAGVPVDDDPGAVVRSLRTWQHARGDALRAGQVALDEWRELSDLLAGGSLADLADAASRRLGQARELAASLPPGAAERAPAAAELAAAIASRSAELAAAERAWHELHGALETLAPGLPDVAGAEEEALSVEAELRRIEALAATIDETLRLLRAAQDKVHRDLAPILADAVRRWLPSISAGAYLDVSVDPADLSVKVKEARSGSWRQARLLSEGTREQIYLLLRVAMAQHLVTTGETAPLLLDEVTAQADGERREAILSMLHALSRERQVILFSHDPEVAAWADTHLSAPDDCLVRLPALTRPDTAASVVPPVPAADTAMHRPAAPPDGGAIHAEEPATVSG